MARVGHYRDQRGDSRFRVFAPGKRQLAVILPGQDRRIPLSCDELGYWLGAAPRLPEGTEYLIEVDGRPLPDPASRCQPRGVHGPSMVVDVARAGPPGWTGVGIADAIVYDLHLGSFTREGTLSAAAAKLPHLAALGVNVVELLPIAAFPGERNWGYDGTYPFALHRAYGTYPDLQRFIEAAHGLGIAVILDVVYNHFGPEGSYAGAFAPYTKKSDTPWGAAINFDDAYNYGVREFFLDNARYWLQEIGFDGFRMDAVAHIIDSMPVHVLRELTDLAARIGREEGREVLMIAEHLRNDRKVTSADGFNFQSQWNDDLNHAVFAKLTGETMRHYANFGSFADVVKALERGFVLDGTRFDRHLRFFVGTDGSGTRGSEHVVHIQNHDQVGNRLLSDRMIVAHGRDKALLAIATIMASPYVPMLFMGEEYGEQAPFPFFEHFSDPVVIDGAREGRKAHLSCEGTEPPDPHAAETFDASKLRWELLETPDGQAILDYYRRLIALKRSGALGPRERSRLRIAADPATELIRIETDATLTVLNFSGRRQPLGAAPEGPPGLCSSRSSEPGWIEADAAMIFLRRPLPVPD
jgi:maltooligosyltrehalose trehalohydrolase